MAERVFQPVMHPDGWVSVSPLPSREELRTFYSDLYYQTTPSTSYQSSYDELAARHRVLKCEALLLALRQAGLADGADFLDVGAGEGFLLDAAHRAGFAVTGLDYSSFGLAKFFPALLDRLRDGDVLDSLEALASAGRRFAACSAINIVEHVLDPNELLSAIGRILRPRGLLAITVPNDYSGLQALLTSEQRIDRDFWFAPPQHLHYFNVDTLPRFCAAQGFAMVDGYSDFPIELYLLHPGSNYIMDARKGPDAHQARLRWDLLLAERGLTAYLQVYRALFGAGQGRNITVILRQGEDVPI